MNEVALALLELLDGRHEPVALQRQIVERRHVHLSLGQIEHFLDLCAEHELLQPGSWRTTEPRPNRRRRGLRYYRRLVVGAALLDWLMRYRHWWANRLMQGVGLLLLVCGLLFALVAPEGPRLAAPFGQPRPALLPGGLAGLPLLGISLLFVGEVILHELAHGLACRLVGVRPGGFGIGLLWWVIPVFYTDTTEAYRVDNKYRRALISAAGPMVDLAALGLCGLIVWCQPPESAWRLAALAYTTLPFSALMINLNPFIVRMDGYWILSDLLEVPNLRRTAWRLVRLQLDRWRGLAINPVDIGERPPTDWRQRLGLVTYGLIAAIWTATFLGLFVINLIRGLVALL